MGKLTNHIIAQLTCQPGQKDRMVFDTVTKGFGVRVSAAGGKVFIAQMTVNGVKRRVPVGSFGVFKLEEARTKAAKILRALQAGTDLVAEKREKAALAAARKKADGFTVRHLIDAWAEARTGERRASYISEAKACLVRNLPDWMGLPASSVTTAMAIEQLDRIKREKSVVAANRTLAYCRAAYGWAVKRQRLAANPLRGIEQPGREQSRERVLSPTELQAIWTACGTLSATQAAFVRFLMLTLCRREEAAGMTWSELDDPGSPTTWTIGRARSKNHRAHVVHLSEAAREILGGLPRIAGNDHVFAGRLPGRAINSFSRMKADLDAKLPDGMPGWCFHDFRRAGVTWLATHGTAPHVADRLLNHLTGTIQGVQAVYQRAEFLAERRTALDAWAGVVVPKKSPERPA